MIITNQYGTVDFDWKEYKDILICFSGGTDSTFMFWLAAKKIHDEKLDTNLHPFTAIDLRRGAFKEETSQATIDMIREEFPLAANRIFPRMVLRSDDEYGTGNAGDEMLRLQVDGTVDLRMMGHTQNPPWEVMLENSMVDERVVNRDAEVEKKEWRLTHKDKPQKHENVKPGGRFFNQAWNPPNKFRGFSPIYLPFANVDARFIAQCYTDFDIWKYFNNTVSCERMRETPELKDSREPCRGSECWWCKEKKWAYGMYDGEYGSDQHPVR